MIKTRSFIETSILFFILFGLIIEPNGELYFEVLKNLFCEELDMFGNN